MFSDRRWNLDREGREVNTAEHFQGNILRIQNVFVLDRCILFLFSYIR